jgi:hypothetical protein
LEKDEAREEPMPPAEQPVMRTYLVGFDVMDNTVGVEVGGERSVDEKKLKVDGTSPYIYLRSLGMRKKQASYV